MPTYKARTKPQKGLRYSNKHNLGSNSEHIADATLV